jgi:hypothetical protein
MSTNRWPDAIEREHGLVTRMALDASVTMVWGFEDEAPPDTEAVLDRLLHDIAAALAVWSMRWRRTPGGRT